MNILMTTETFLPRMGGGEIHCKNIYLSLLKQKNYTLKLFTLEQKISKEEDNFNIIREKDNLFNYFKIIYKLNFEIKKSNIVHSHYCYKLALISGILSKIHGKPFIITLHGFGILDRKGSFFFRKFHNFCRKYSLKLATKIISTSNDLAIPVQKYTDINKITVIHNGVDIVHFNKKTKLYEELKDKYRGKTILLTVRRLNDKNGVHFLIDSLKYLRNKNLKFKYLIIGWGPNENLIKQKITEYKLEEYVDFIGRVDNLEVVDYLHLSDIVLFPSSAESTSLACIEAMLLKNLLIVSKVGGLIELIGINEDRGRFLKMFDWETSNYYPPKFLSEKIYKNMAKIIEDSIKYKYKYKLKIKNAKSFVIKNYDWDFLSKKTIEIYQKSYDQLNKK